MTYVAFKFCKVRCREIGDEASATCGVMDTRVVVRGRQLAPKALFWKVSENGFVGNRFSHIAINVDSRIEECDCTCEFLRVLEYCIA